MKKILITIIFLHALTLNTYAAELKDCSVYSKFNPKFLACKTANIAKGVKDYQSEQWSGKKKDKEEKKD
jgi:hypothetical protein